MENKIKIAYVVKYLKVNGITTVLVNWCRKLDKSKFDITIFSGEPIDNNVEKILIENNIKIKKMPEKRGKNPLKYYIYLLKNINRKEFDIFHVHGNSSLISVELLLAFLKGIKIRIAHSHNTTCDCKKANVLLKPLFNLVCTDRFACGEAAGRWMFNKKKFVIIPNGIDVKKFIFNENERNNIRKELGIENKYVIGHIGMFNDQKNHEFIIDFFEKYLKKHKDTILLLIGAGPNFSFIKELVKNKHMENNVILYGNSNEVYKLYNVMDIFILPSKYEGFPIVLLEAQINGLKCLVSNTVSNEVNISSNVEFITINNIDLWVQNILNNESSRESRKEYFEKNKKIYLKYEIDECVKKLENEYNKILEREDLKIEI